MPRYLLCVSHVPAVGFMLDQKLQYWKNGVIHQCFYGELFFCYNCSAPQVVAMAASLVQREYHAVSDALRKVEFFTSKSSLMRYNAYIWH